MINQRATDAPAPRRRFDEERVQFNITILSTSNCRKPLDRASFLCHEHAAPFNLTEWQVDGIGVGQQ